MNALPIEPHLPEIVAALKKHRRAVVVAPPGSGKSTRIPLALVESGLAGEGQIAMLQPRRVAARSTARYMAQCLNQPIGKTVGYQVRFEKRASSGTRIMVMTEGILTRRLVQDATLDGVSLLILDEFHERSLDSDLALASARELLQVRDDFSLLVMSATMDPGPLADYLQAPLIRCSHQPHPLDLRRLALSAREDWRTVVIRLIREAIDDGRNGILVFLSGAGEIRQLQQRLNEVKDLAVFPLYGALAASDQDRALSDIDSPKVVLATNLAETSLTVPGIDTVIDLGYARIMRFDGTSAMDRLDRERISRASADQRAGRAARLGPGRATRLWSAERDATLKAFTDPEIQRVDLTAFTLTLLSFHGPHIQRFPFFEKPPERALQQATAVLTALGAIDRQHRLTPQGTAMTRFPLHPRLAAMVVRAQKIGAGRTAAACAAILSEERLSDGADMPDRVQQVLSLSASVSPRVRKAFQQIINLLPNQPETNVALGQILLHAYPDRICVLVNQQYLARNGSAVMVRQGAAQLDSEFILALDLQQHGNTLNASVCLPLKWQTLVDELDIECVDKAVFDADRKAVLSRRLWQFQGQTLRCKEGVHVDADELAQVLAEQVETYWDQVFQPNRNVQRLLARLRFASTYLSEQPWPDVTRPGLIKLARQNCHGKRKISDLTQLDWEKLIVSQMQYPHRKFLDQEIPEKVLVPSGRLVAVTYTDTQSVPVLAVKLQEMFGCTDTPTIASGRIPLLLHLLAPNGRPVQVTQDLRSFWANTYLEVRKELRQRYPKHPWPEDPFSVKPTRYTKGRLKN